MINMSSIVHPCLGTMFSIALGSGTKLFSGSLSPRKILPLQDPFFVKENPEECDYYQVIFS